MRFPLCSIHLTLTAPPPLVTPKQRIGADTADAVEEAGRIARLPRLRLTSCCRARDPARAAFVTAQPGSPLVLVLRQPIQRFLLRSERLQVPPGEPVVADQQDFLD